MKKIGLSSLLLLTPILIKPVNGKDKTPIKQVSKEIAEAQHVNAINKFNSEVGELAEKYDEHRHSSWELLNENIVLEFEKNHKNFNKIFIENISKNHDPFLEPSAELSQAREEFYNTCILIAKLKKRLHPLTQSDSYGAQRQLNKLLRSSSELEKLLIFYENNNTSKKATDSLASLFTKMNKNTKSLFKKNKASFNEVVDNTTFYKKSALKRYLSQQLKPSLEAAEKIADISKPFETFTTTLELKDKKMKAGRALAEKTLDSAEKYIRLCADKKEWLGQLNEITTQVLEADFKKAEQTAIQDFEKLSNHFEKYRQFLHKDGQYTGTAAKLFCQVYNGLEKHTPKLMKRIGEIQTDPDTTLNDSIEA